MLVLKDKNCSSLGMSKKHASSADLILNLQTEHTSIQFHAVLDNNFDMVDSLQRGIEEKQWK